MKCSPIQIADRLRSMDNIFFNRSQLKYCGERVIIGKTVRIRYPELVEIHDDVIIDDFVFISTGLIMENHSTIMPHSSITGGIHNKVHLKRYSGIASHCSLMTGSHDFTKSLHLMHHNDFPQNFLRGNIVLEEHSIIGTHCTVMPGITIGPGTRTGAHTMICKNLDPWTLYVGCPPRKAGTIDKQNIRNSLQNFILYDQSVDKS